MRLCDDYEQRLAQAKEERDRFYKKLVAVSSEVRNKLMSTLCKGSCMLMHASWSDFTSACEEEGPIDNTMGQEIS